MLNGHGSTKTTTHWKCENWRSHQCKVTMITFEDSILNVANEHNHQFLPGKSKACQVVQPMKKIVENQVTVNLAVFAAEIPIVDNEVALQFSFLLRVAIARARNS